MQTLAQFKKELGVETIEFMKSNKTGTQFTTVRAKNIIISRKADVSKPLYVTMMTRTADGEEIAPETAYVIHNAGAEVGTTL